MRVSVLTAVGAGREAWLPVTGESVALARAVRERLAARARDGAEFPAALHPREAFGPTVADEVEFLIAPNPGVPAGPLREIASGGELSRVMLAVEVVFAGADPVPTFVFDEVDAGVGGAALFFPGLYHVEISHPKTQIPSRYNTASELGWEVDPFSRAGTTARFDLTSK